MLSRSASRVTSMTSSQCTTWNACGDGAAERDEWLDLDPSNRHYSGASLASEGVRVARVPTCESRRRRSQGAAESRVMPPDSRTCTWARRQEDAASSGGVCERRDDTTPHRQQGTQALRLRGAASFTT